MRGLWHALGKVIAAVCLVVVLGVPGARAQVAAPVLSGLARFEPVGSSLKDVGGRIALDLLLSQPVPYRISTMDNPPRLVVDFREVDWSAFHAAGFSHSRHVTAVQAGVFQPGWSRFVMEMDGPYGVAQAEMATHEAAGRAAVRLELTPVSADVFAKGAAVASAGQWALPKPALVGMPKRRQTGDKPLVVVLDPGHGGIDPGSINGKVEEKQITLQFARLLREDLIRAGMQVVMTRPEDIFVPLETRISVARATGADLFLSIHADAEVSREAAGATVYTLSEGATDKASAELAARHDRDDLLAGVDLKNADDQIAKVLMDMARTETMPRSESFANTLVTSIKAAGLRMHRRPHQVAAFSVLKSPDVPSALLELGYLSSASDFKNLMDPAWRRQMAAAIVEAVQKWAKTDAAEAALVRQ
ncbi:MAG: N-acetylmuramoyl-L-alanine amidase [Paracoccaceae bacterium]|nr:N-acetylmuramoyl-L-alanine amidase [Paracoccaceae bacterium]